MHTAPGLVWCRLTRVDLEWSGAGSLGLTWTGLVPAHLGWRAAGVVKVVCCHGDVAVIMSSVMVCGTERIVEPLEEFKRWCWWRLTGINSPQVLAVHKPRQPLAICPCHLTSGSHLTLVGVENADHWRDICKILNPPSSLDLSDYHAACYLIGSQNHAEDLCPRNV